MKDYKIIPGYSQHQASRKGVIRRFDNHRTLLNAPTSGGYLRTKVKEDFGGWKHMYTHRLVALTYLDNPENKPEVNHINGIKTDNRVENLEWMTAKENHDHSVHTGLQVKRTAEVAFQAKSVLDMVGHVIFGYRGLHDSEFHLTGVARVIANPTKKYTNQGYYWSKMAL